MAKKESLLDALEKPYSLPFFSQQVLQPVFGSNVKIFTTSIPMVVNPSEQHAVKWIKKYGEISVTDYKQVDLYEVALNDNVVVERNKVSIGAVVKKLIAGNNAVLVNFYYPNQTNKNWRFSFIARDKKIEEGKVVEAGTNPKRYTYVLGPNERCRTAAERFFKLSVNPEFDIEKLQEAFSVEKLSKTFFDEYKEHYEAFVKHLSKREIKASVFNGDDKSVRDFAKKLLGRIVFLYFVQKKGWLGASNDKWQDGNPNFMQDLFISSGKKETFYPLWLRTLFYDSLNNPDSKDNVFTLPDSKKVKVPYLNGGLFEDDDPKGSSKYLVFPPTLFTDLFEFFNQYNFTIYEDSPDDHTIAVDPEMLGHIFENLLEDNKDKGAYYTPKEIVHYMCQESLIQYLATKLDIPENKTFQELGTDQQGMFGNEVKKGQLDILKENKTITPGITRADVERFIKQKETTPQIIKHAADINKHLDNVKICDPAIGSGAFPMGLLHEIFNAKQVLKEVANIPELQKTGNAKIKEDIIQNSIYGVDIEKGAVDIARLRFWLSLIVDEELPRPLPNLDFKIVVGDSLIPKFDGEVVDIDWEAKYTTSANEKLYKKMKSDLTELVDAQKKYFSAKNDKDKSKLKQQIRDLKIEILINQLQLDKAKYSSQNTVNEDMFGGGKKEKELGAAIQLKISGFNQSIKKLEHLQKQSNKPLQFFDWKLDFPEIMNSTITNANIGFDILVGNPPYVSALELKKIMPSSHYEYLKEKYITAKGTIDLYIYFFEKGLNLLRFNGVLSFISPNRYLSASYGAALREFIYNNARIDTIIDYSHIRVFAEASTYPILSFIKKQIRSDYIIRIGKYDELENKIKYKRTSSEKLHFTEGFIWGFLLNDKIQITEKVFMQGEMLSNVCKINATSTASEADDFHTIINEKSGYKLINTGTIDQYATTWGVDYLTDKGKKYLKPYLPINSKRISENRKKLYSSPKIIFSKIAIIPEAFYDQYGEYSSVNTNCLHSFSSKNDPKYILAWVNSKLFQYTFECFFEGLKMQGGYLLYSSPNISCMMIKTLDGNSQKQITKIVDKILDLKKNDPYSDTTRLQRQIDVHIYHFYNLTYSEAKLIDETITEEEWEKWKV